MKRVQMLTELPCANDGYDSVAEARADSKNLPPGTYYPVTLLRKSPLVVKEPERPTENVAEWGESFIKRVRKEASGD